MVLVEVYVCSLGAVEQVHCLLLLSRGGAREIVLVRPRLGVRDLGWLSECRAAEAMPNTQLLQPVSGFFGGGCEESRDERSR